MAGLEDLLGGILGGGQQAAPQASTGAVAGLDVGQLSAGISKVMMVVGPLLAMYARNGGLQELLDKLGGGGLAGHTASWVGTGPNQALAGSQVAAALPDEVAMIAQQSGLNPDEVAAELSRVLPGLVDAVTPNGRVPADQQEADQVLAQVPGGDALKAMLGAG